MILASKLCLAAGILDVERWLVRDDAKRILDWWEAFDRINPLPDPWVQTATSCFEMASIQRVLLAVNGVKTDDSEVPSWQDWMPPRYKPGKRPKPKEQSPEEQREVAEKWAKV